MPDFVQKYESDRIKHFFVGLVFRDAAAAKNPKEMLHQFIADRNGRMFVIVEGVDLVTVFGLQNNIMRQHQGAVEPVGGLFQQFFFSYLLVDSLIFGIGYCDILNQEIAFIFFLFFGISIGIGRRISNRV